jgi:la-related protein 1
MGQSEEGGRTQASGSYQNQPFRDLPPFGSSDPGDEMDSYHHHLSTGNRGSFVMGTPTGFSPTPAFGFTAIQPAYHDAPPSHDFAPMPSHSHLNRTGMPQFANQGWHQPTPMHFVPRGYFGSDNHDWPISEHAYGNHVPMVPDSRGSMSPQPTMAPWLGLNHSSGEVQSRAASVGVGAVSPALGQGFRPGSGPELPSFQLVGAPLAIAGDDRSKRENSLRKPTPKKPGTKKGKNDKAALIRTELQPSPRKKPPSTKKKSQKVATLADQTSGTVTPANASVTDEAGGSIYDDPTDPKRTDLIENPATRFAFKEFYRNFRSKERLSFYEAEEFAMKSLEDGSLPEKVHWRIYLEMADLAKRSNRFADARRLYQQVCQLQPYASQGWLEYSKLEEECGHLNRCTKILHAGLEYCEYSENLLTRAVKHEEKMGNLGRARELLARLKHVGIEKVWRTVLEGALLEARAGNVVMARRVLKYLMHHVPWYGPLYLEAYRLEREKDRPTEALAVVERGLRAIPRYGPLWFGAFRLCETMDLSAKDFDLPKTMVLIGRAAKSISKELIWKVHLDAALMQERAAVQQAADDPENKLDDLMTPCRQSFALTVLTCPPNLRWKVWLAAGRMEVAAGNSEKARALFLRAHQVVPDKGRATTILECARLEEFIGDTELAVAILCKSRIEMGGDWKVWLESVLLEIRCGKYKRAIEIAEDALESHSGTGRLWAALVQLRHAEGGEEAQYISLEQALRAVPKSGEVWCEGGRILLNPFSKSFDLEKARRHLFFATRFTPQYGDSFLETLRLELLDQWIAPIASVLWETTSTLVYGEGESATDEHMAKCIMVALRMLSDACSSKSLPGTDLDGRTFDIVAFVKHRLDASKCCEMVDIHDLQLRCTNADPNYGLLWFHCRNGPTDTARQVLTYAKVKLSNELIENIPIYVAAMIRRWSIIYSMEHESNQDFLDRTQGNRIEQDPVEWEEAISLRLRSSPSVDEILEEGGRICRTGMELLESSLTGSDFITGLVELNRHQALVSMTPEEKRKALFGTDALFS